MNILSSTDCFVVSQLFSNARHAGRFKVGSKPAYLYARLSILPLSHLDDLCQRGNYYALCMSFRLFTFCATRYRSALFDRRALLYAVGGGQSLIPLPGCSTPGRRAYPECSIIKTNVHLICNYFFYCQIKIKIKEHLSVVIPYFLPVIIHIFFVFSVKIFCLCVYFGMK